MVMIKIFLWSRIRHIMEFEFLVMSLMLLFSTRVPTDGIQVHDFIGYVTCSCQSRPVMVRVDEC